MSLVKDVIGYGAHADRPAAGHEGRLYYETDTDTLFRDNGTTWNTLNLGSGGSSSIVLDWSATTNLANETALTDSTWEDLCPNQDFTVSDSSSIHAVSVRGQAQAGENSTTGAVASRFVLDSGGSPQHYSLGAGWKIGSENTYVNIFDGANTVFIAGLAAGTHTIKIQTFPNVAGFALYCRAADFPDTESLHIQIVEL